MLWSWLSGAACTCCGVWYAGGGSGWSCCWTRSTGWWDGSQSWAWAWLSSSWGCCGAFLIRCSRSWSRWSSLSGFAGCSSGSRIGWLLHLLPWPWGRWKDHCWCRRGARLHCYLIGTVGSVQPSCADSTDNSSQSSLVTCFLSWTGCLDSTETLAFDWHWWELVELYWHFSPSYWSLVP